MYVLHRVLYPQVHDNGVKKTKNKKVATVLLDGDIVAPNLACGQ